MHKEKARGWGKNESLFKKPDKKDRGGARGLSQEKGYLNGG